jgi:transcriptional regulator with XRE-family HTH domain
MCSSQTLLVRLTNECKSLLLVSMTEMDVYRALGRAIRKRRKELGLTQADVAERIGLARASLANIETGRQKVLLHQIYRLVAALQLQSIIDLVPPLVVSEARAAKPLAFGGSNVTPTEKAQLETLIQLAIGSGRKTGTR